MTRFLPSTASARPTSRNPAGLAVGVLAVILSSTAVGVAQQQATDAPAAIAKPIEPIVPPIQRVQPVTPKLDPRIKAGPKAAQARQQVKAAAVKAPSNAAAANTKIAPPPSGPLPAKSGGVTGQPTALPSKAAVPLAAGVGLSAKKAVPAASKAPATATSTPAPAVKNQ